VEVLHVVFGLVIVTRNSLLDGVNVHLDGLDVRLDKLGDFLAEQCHNFMFKVCYS